MSAGSPIPLTCQPKYPPVPFLRSRNQRKVTALRWENLLPRAQEPICALLGPSKFYYVEVPADYGIDLQLAEAGRSKFMAGRSEITGTAASQIGDEVFHRLVGAGFNQPFAWKMTIVDDNIVNAGSTAGGKIYVHAGMLSLLGQNKGLWAAVLSHEIAHTGRRHQVADYMRRLYIQRTIQYYRARAAAGDKSANWGLIAFTASSAIALKKMERDQEHDADQQGMLIMARAGYQPDNVFALHHLLLMKMGEQSKFSAFFSDHPRWETRDQRSDKVYGDAVAEFDRLWPDAANSPGGSPPVVAFLGEPAAKTNKQDGTVDVTLPVYCRNTLEKVDVVLMFNNRDRTVTAADAQYADKDGRLTFHEKTDCLEDRTAPIVLHVPASAVSNHDRSVTAAAYVASNGEAIAGSRAFEMHFPSTKRAAAGQPIQAASKSVLETNHAEILKTPQQPVHTETNQDNPAIMTSSLQSSPTQSNERGAATRDEGDQGTLIITSTNLGSDIFVDSVGRGKTPATFKVKAGKHSIQVASNGYQDWLQDVSVDAGKSLSITANLNSISPVPTAIPNAHASEVRVSTTDAAPGSIAIATTPSGGTAQESFLGTSTSVGKGPSAVLSPAGSETLCGIGVAAVTGAFGVIITDVTLSGPAMEAGLKIGDTVIGIDDKSVKTIQMMDTATGHRSPGSTIRVNYIRNGIAVETTVSLQDRSALKSQL